MGRSYFVIIEGAIGVGKTTLARLLQPAFDADLLLEEFEENPFLADFYVDRSRYAFQTQLFFCSAGTGSNIRWFRMHWLVAH